MPSTFMLTSDDLWNFFAFLPIRDRIRCSAVCKDWRHQLESWADINQVFLGEYSACFASDVMSSVVDSIEKQNISEWVDNILPMLLKKSPNIKVLIIESRDLVHHLLPSLKGHSRIHSLILSHDFFSLDFRNRTPSHLKVLLSYPSLRHFYVLCNNSFMLSKSNIITLKAVQALVSDNIADIILQGILLGVKVIEYIAQRYQNSLKSLAIGGVVCDSRRPESYIKAFANIKALEFLQIPASVFSLSQEPLPRYLPSLKDLTSLKRLDVSIVEIDMNNIKTFITRLLPPNLESLYLVDNSTGGRIDVGRLEKIKPDLKIFYISSTASKKLDLAWMTNESNLIYRPYWLPPYFQPIENFSVIITNEMLVAQQRNSQFLHLDFDIDEDNQEQILDIDDSEEPLFDSQNIDSP